MHSETFDFQNQSRNFNIELPAGEDFQLDLINQPAFGERVLTVGAETDGPPLLEQTGFDFVHVAAERLADLPEGKLCRFNLWQREGDQLELVAEGRFVRRATIAPVQESGQMSVGVDGPILLIDGDSVMENIPGTRVFLEQLVGDKFRFPEGYLGAVGGDSAKAIYNSAPELLQKVVPGKTVVLVGPIGANQTTEDDSFAEITSYGSAIYSAYLAAGAKVVAVPTLLDGMGVTSQDAKKTALAAWVSAFGLGGSVTFEEQDFELPELSGFYPVDVSGFDRTSMKSDVSHPNAQGARYLAEAISNTLRQLVHGDVFDAVESVNLIEAGAAFEGARSATAPGVTGIIPANWDVQRNEGNANWGVGFDAAGYFEVSIDNAASDSTLVVTLPSVEINAEAGDVLTFVTDIEIADPAVGLKSVGVSGAGSSIMTLDPAWSAEPGTYVLRTRDESYLEAQPTENLQVFVRVAAGANLRVLLKQASAFLVEGDLSEAAPVPSPSVPSWDAAINTGAPEELAYAQSDQMVSATAAISGIRHTRGADPLLGKRYFECLLGAEVLGVGVGTTDVAALNGGGFGTGRSFWSGSVLFHTGGNQSMGFSLDEGDIVQIAVDRDADLIWMRVNGAGDWNADAAADPATGTGGLSISGMSGDLFAYAGLNAVSGASVTLQGSAAGLAYVAPTGFEPISG